MFEDQEQSEPEKKQEFPPPGMAFFEKTENDQYRDCHPHIAADMVPQAVQGSERERSRQIVKGGKEYRRHPRHRHHVAHPHVAAGRMERKGQAKVLPEQDQKRRRQGEAEKARESVPGQCV